LYAQWVATLETALRLFQGLPPTGWAACTCILPPWIPHAIRLCSKSIPLTIFEKKTK
jgi:hypothetical protein